MRVAVWTLLLCLCGAPCAAGPWPRAEGGLFFALSAGAADVSLWAEYGLRKTRWIAADLRRDADGTVTGALIFNQALPLPGALADRAVAAFSTRSEVTRSPEGFYGSSTRITLSAGIGFSAPLSGWATAAAAYEYSETSEKLLSDWSLGLQVRPRFAALFQGEYERALLSPATRKLGATAVVHLRDNLRVTAGLWRNSAGTGELRLGTWLEF